MLVLVLLKASCHFLEIHKMMVYYKKRWRQDTSTQACHFDAYDKSFSLPPPGPSSATKSWAHWPHSTAPFIWCREKENTFSPFPSAFHWSRSHEHSPANQDTAGCCNGNSPHLVQHWWLLGRAIKRDNFAQWSKNIFGAFSSTLQLKKKSLSTEWNCFFGKKKCQQLNLNATNVSAHLLYPVGGPSYLFHPGADKPEKSSYLCQFCRPCP